MVYDPPKKWLLPYSACASQKKDSDGVLPPSASLLLLSVPGSVRVIGKSLELCSINHDIQWQYPRYYSSYLHWICLRSSIYIYNIRIIYIHIYIYVFFKKKIEILMSSLVYFPLGKYAKSPTKQLSQLSSSYAGRPEAAACELSSHRSPGALFSLGYFCWVYCCFAVLWG